MIDKKGKNRKRQIGGSRNMTFRVAADLDSALARRAEEESCSVSRIVDSLIRTGLMHQQLEMFTELLSDRLENSLLRLEAAVGGGSASEADRCNAEELLVGAAAAGHSWAITFVPFISSSAFSSTICRRVWAAIAYGRFIAGRDGLERLRLEPTMNDKLTKMMAAYQDAPNSRIELAALKVVAGAASEVRGVDPSEVAYLRSDRGFSDSYPIEEQSGNECSAVEAPKALIPVHSIRTGDDSGPAR